MRSIRLARFLLLVGLLSLPLPCVAAEIDFVIDPGTKWKLEDGARDRFNRFLETERQVLLRRIPGLDFPKSFGPVESGIAQYMSAETKRFRNRQAACSFLGKLRGNLEPERRSELDSLTRNGAACVQADIEPARQLDWTRDLARLVWGARWIPWEGKVLSLRSYIERTASRPGPFVEPRILVMRQGTFDGWGIARSAKDREFIESVGRIKDAFAAARRFDPNEPGTFGSLGPEFKGYIEKDPFNAANLLLGQATIYLSNGWPPNAMVELLAHEYGHIFRHRQSRHYSGEDKQVVWMNDEVHEEAAAEAFAWMTLHPLYDAFPEIEVFHVAKLMFMNEVSPNNFHYVGAAAFQDRFHGSVSRFDKLRALDSASELGVYLRSENIHTLTDQGPAKRTTVRARF